MGDLETLKDLRNQFSELKSRRKKYEAAWDEITEILLPNLSLYAGDDNNHEGEKYGQKIHDGIGISSLDTMTNGYVGYMVSRATPWFKLDIKNEKISSQGKIKMFLQDTEKALYKELANSNFYEVLPRLFKNGAGIGTAFASVEENYDKGISVILTHHHMTIYVVYDKYGNLITVFRVFELSIRDVCSNWKDSVPEEVKQLLENNRHQKINVYHAVVVNDDYDPEKESKYKKQYNSYYYLDGHDKFLSVGGFDEMPYIGWLWRQEEGEDYGRGKGHDSLVMLRRSNLIAKTLDQGAEISMNPPIQYHEDMEDIIDLTPNGMNPYRDPEKVIIPVELGKNYPIGRDREEMYNTVIKETFHVDFFLALRNKSKQMTAREVNELQGEKAAIMGTDIGSINNGLLDPLIEKIYFNAYEQGRMPPVPEELLQVPGQKIDIDYIGPLAQAQKRYHQTQGLKLGLEDTLPLAQVDPQILDNFDFDAIVRVYSENDGMPAETLRDPKEVKKIRAARAQAQQEAMQQQQLAQGVDMADKLNQPKEEGSLLEEVGKQLAGAVPGNKGATP